MAKKLSDEKIKQILEVTKKARSDASKVKFAGRKLFERHCGQRMARVRVLEEKRDGSTEEKRSHLVCVSCLQHKFDGDSEL